MISVASNPFISGIRMSIKQCHTCNQSIGILNWTSYQPCPVSNRRHHFQRCLNPYPSRCEYQQRDRGNQVLASGTPPTGPAVTDDSDSDNPALEDENWTITELPFNSGQYSVAHPALSADGKTLYFALDMPGTLGQSNLLV
jgi:hypothetical protein